MTEAELLRVLELAAGVALSLIGVCRINQMRIAHPELSVSGWRIRFRLNLTLTRPLFAAAYIGLTVGAAGLALGAMRPQDASEWHQALLLISVLVLLWDTRGRWSAGPPADTGSRP